MNFVKCGQLDNIVYDYVNNKLPIDDIINDSSFFDGLTWKEESNIKKYYFLAIKNGNQSIYHLKLVYTIQDIIKKYFNGARWHNKFITVSLKDIK